ncbi:hypothetical protein [Methylobacterium pseudosasicola]|uniref:Uncharacterized protein n=1 Tax=Methylobacterium pseudosasicola TaxID=582667 RepID=A0A1I4P2Y2_9HYPH|nr:hypothetical protein [Methylobacterium pseudosasicola]SFM22161.1 hypothetical protein SAMN05192568_102321 [Methylobacterium pseudosasicola]
MTEPPAPPDWAATATRAAMQAASELGLGSGFADLDAQTWARLRDRTAEILSGAGGTLPPDWERALAHVLGRPDPDELARDEADTVLAEQGEVFAPEDDA